jgi:hypothetical protein
MHLRKLTYIFFFTVLTAAFNFANAGEPELKKSVINREDTLKTDGSTKSSKLDNDEGIKCTRAELLEREFIAVGGNKYGEILRLTFQDLERGGREIIFQKKLMENDAVKFYMPNDLIKEAKTAVLIVLKGDKMYFKKIDLTDEE